VLAVRGQSVVRAAQRQTVYALSRLTDEGGFTSPGHAARVARLAVQVGREFGMPEPLLRDVEYAALLHDLGQVSLDRPIPGGATVHISAVDQRRMAATGAALLARTAELSRLSAIVAHQATPHWRSEQLGELPLGSRIVRVVNAYDDLTGTADTRAERVEALQRLRLSAGYDYDPQVLAALCKVLRRGGQITQDDVVALDV
jgi:HD-GYP domain-containing protein (c-di-GMP phosphodiesterase class II)